MLSDQPEHPERVLIVSADMGEGHNATGRALEEAVRERWPGVTIRWLDTLDVMGRGVGPAFRRIYVTNVQRTPWLYEFFYDSLCRYPWFAATSKRIVGSWAGRRLVRHLGEFQPDVILSTYPLGTAGLDWLRVHRGLRTPVGAWVSDFAPHPFWVYRNVDLNLVMHPVAIAPAGRWEPGAPVGVSAPPVKHVFAPGDRAAARRALDLPAEGFVALVSCGSLGFGSVESAARTLVECDPAITVVVACGRNEALRERLLRGGDHGGRLRALGWTDRMPELTVACDAVVTNAGGATSLEALACGRAVLMYQPIAAHGRANAGLMAAAGLAEVCADPAELAATVRKLIAEPNRLAELEETALRHANAHSVGDGLAALLTAASTDGTPALRRLRAEDALFVHVETPEVPQQVGAVLVLDPKPDGSPPTLADAADLVDAAPGLRGRIVGGTPWRQPAWQPDESIRAIDIVELVELGRPDTPSDLDGALDAFFSVPLDGRDGTGRAQLIHGLEGGRSALLVKLHHASSDGIAVTGALVARARGQEFIVDTPRDPGDAPKPTPRQRLAKAVELARGIATLARAGKAPHTALDGPTDGPQRHHARVELPVADVRAAARALHTRTTDLATALLAEALHRVLAERGDEPDSIRVMMPRSTRTTATFRSSGNHTGAASVDLPLGPMPLAERVTRTRAATSAQVTSSAPHAAHAVVWALGVLPPWLHRRAAKLVYRSTWFNAIASVLPGARSDVILHGSKIAIVYPVLALAPGVGLSVGIMTWADLVTFCFTGNSRTAGTVDALAEAVRAAFKAMSAEPGRSGQV